MTQTVLLGIPDLLLSARVNAVARALGIPAVATFTPHDLLSKAHGENSVLLVIDLVAQQLDPLGSIRNLRDDIHTGSLKIIGFLPKPDEESIHAAMAAGCDLVLSKSQLLESIPEVLRGALLKA
jgi:DNA-binding NarL/FixJ family response regulator